MESKASTKKKKSRRRFITLSKYSNNTQKIVVFYKRWKKSNEIQLATKQNGLEHSRNEMHNRTTCYCLATNKIK